MAVCLHPVSAQVPMVHSFTGPQLHPLPPGHTRCKSCRQVYPSDTIGLCPQCHPRHECNSAGCSQPAYFSLMFYALGPFDYCSPQCRDKDLVHSGKAKRATMDLLNQLRKGHQEALQQDMSTRGGVNMGGRSGWQLDSNSAETTEMEVDNPVKADDPAGMKPPLANELGNDIATARDDPAPKKVKRSEEDKHDARQPSQEERRARNILHIDLSRQASKRLGLIFHCDQQHGVSSVT